MQLIWNKLCIFVGLNLYLYNFVASILVELNINSPIVDCDTVTVTFSSNGRTQCQLNNRYFTYCRSPYRQSGLRGGEHTITIRTTDGRGGYKQKSVTFTIILGKHAGK